jgi:ABC-2 type transport system ATP-binding protein
LVVPCDFGLGITWVRGSNGSGKSTLLRLLGGALPARAGSLRVRGIDVSAAGLDCRREVFWCGPGAIGFEYLLPREYFAFSARLYPSFSFAAVQDTAVRLGPAAVPAQPAVGALDGHAAKGLAGRSPCKPAPAWFCLMNL